MVAMLLTDGDRMINPHRGSSINDIHAVLFHLAKRSQRRRFKC